MALNESTPPANYTPTEGGTKPVPRRHFFLLGLGGGAVAFALVCFLCWRDEIPWTYRGSVCRAQIAQFTEAVKTHQQKTGELPTSLAAVPEIGQKYGGDPNDPWERPYLYEVQGRDFDIVSYGHDGQPGGIGIDADYHGARPNDPVDRHSTLSQFIQTRSLWPVMIGGVMAAFPIVFAYGVTAPGESPSSIKKALMLLVVLVPVMALIGTFFAAVCSSSH
ncbi:MAG: type II secretion system protein GspG [Planctomycetota bacterium]|nr:type II secretion system protein GspG [Planctomycetota bacterium]